MRVLKDFDTFATGVFLMLAALLALYLAWPLSSTSSVGMGPGYIPKVFVVIQLGFGAVIAAHGLIYPGEPSEQWHLRPLLLVLAAIAFFALSVERFGLAVALMGLVLISCAAHTEARLRDSILLAVASVLLSWLIFVKALGLPLALWPVWSAA